MNKKVSRENLFINNYFSLAPKVINDMIDFSGFYFDSKLGAKAYYRYIYRKLQKQDDMVFFPRGNLSSTTKYIFIQSGLYKNTQDDPLLSNLLHEFQIYPYFTSVLKTEKEISRLIFSEFIRELHLVFQILHEVYGIKRIQLVFLGNMDLFYDVKRTMKRQLIKEKANLKFTGIRIWHPMYVRQQLKNNDKIIDLWYNSLHNKSNKLL